MCLWSSIQKLINHFSVSPKNCPVQIVDWLHAQLEKGMYWKIIAQTEEWTDVLKEKQKMFSFFKSETW